MRTAFATALALSLSLTVVRADETPEPLFVDDVASVAEPPSNTPADPATPIPSNAAAGYRPAPGQPELPGEPARVAPKVCVMLKAESFEIRTTKAVRPMSAEPAAYLICDNVTTTSTAGGATTLKCTNCKLALPNGVSATASDVAFDTKTNLLILTGSDKSPVTVTMAGTESKAAKVEMKIDPSEWRGAQLVAPAAYGVPPIRQMAPTKVEPSQQDYIGPR